jgi:hypothetical protein
VALGPIGYNLPSLVLRSFANGLRRNVSDLNKIVVSEKRASFPAMFLSLVSECTRAYRLRLESERDEVVKILRIFLNV